MKKNYHRPELFFEDFALMDSIAACSHKVGFTEDTCTWYSEDLDTTIFTSSLQGCQTSFEDFAGMGLGCSHVPAGEIILFGS